MSKKEERRLLASLKEHRAMRREILEKFGNKVIGKATLRLCANCKISGCNLMPITTDGRDCPYFKQREKKE